MAEQLWRSVELDRGEGCPNCGWEGLHPIPAGALLIEDGEEAAVEAMLPYLRSFLMVDHHDEVLRMELRKMLRAAIWGER